MPDTVTSTSLAQLAREGRDEELEKVWLDEISSPGKLEPYFDTFDALLERKNQELIGILAGMLAESLESAGRQDAVLELLEHLADAGVEQFSGVDIGKTIEAAYGDQAWFGFVIGKLGVAVEAMRWDSFLEFRKLCSYLPGAVVFHRSGWGEGVVEELDEEEDEVSISFATGTHRQLPWQTVVDTMNALPAWDLRSMKMTDEEGLTKLIKEQPGEVIRRALKVYRGKATSTQIKDLLYDKIVPGRSWTTWWKKAKTAAVEDPLVHVEGSSARPVFTLRKRALTLDEEARWELRHEASTQAFIQGMRSYLERCTRDEDRERIIAFAVERLKGKITPDAPNVSMDMVEASVFLEQLGAEEAETTNKILTRFLGCGPDESPNLSEIHRLEDAETQRFIVTRLPELLGANGPKFLATQLPSIPDDCLEELLELLKQSDCTEELLATYRLVAAFPNKHPALIFFLTKSWAEGAFDKTEEPIDPAMALRVIIHVLRVVLELPKGATNRTKLLNRIVTLLTGKRALLAEMLEVSDRRTVDSVRQIGSRVGEEYPPRVQEVVERIAHARFPEIYQVREIPFWEDMDVIYTTQAGLDAREAEFVELRDVKIPANSKAIGAAASLGDLSENAEWEAAMEEQRVLTGRAAQMEDELRRVRLIEQQTLPDGVVAPGTRVSYLDLDTGEEETIRILGPWDGVHGNDVISYRAPLASHLLGTQVEDETTIVLPTGERKVRILRIEAAF